MKIICFIFVIFASSCTFQPAKKYSNKKIINQLADRSCQAVLLRQERFSLANKIRFAADSLTAATGRTDTMRFHNKLIVYLKEKDSLLKASMVLANTIHQQLDSIMPYNDKSAQKRFDAQMDSMLKAKGCLITTK